MEERKNARAKRRFRRGRGNGKVWIGRSLVEKAKGRIVRTTDVDAVAGNTAGNERKKGDGRGRQSVVATDFTRHGRRTESCRAATLQFSIKYSSNGSKRIEGWIVGRETSPRRPGSIRRRSRLQRQSRSVSPRRRLQRTGMPGTLSGPPTNASPRRERPPRETIHLHLGKLRKSLRR